MTIQTNHHPTDSLLRDFSAGTLASGMSVAVSAHLDYCETCRDSSRRIRAELASEWLAGEPDSYSAPQAMLDSITSQPQVSGESEQSMPTRGVELHMHERSVSLPPVLSKLAERGVVWRKLAGGINSASLKLDNEAQCDFMYMKPGSQAPRHTHMGVEVTLVLDGTFEDELGSYQPGDFILREGSHVHTPRSDDGCLCYSVLDRPLRFKSGWVRLLNPFQEYLFNRQLSR